jgi:hypothetical protein
MTRPIDAQLPARRLYRACRRPTLNHVRDFVREQRGRIWLGFLPTYSPEMNSVESIGRAVERHYFFGTSGGLSRGTAALSRSSLITTLSVRHSLSCNAFKSRSWFCAPKRDSITGRTAASGCSPAA